MGIEDLDFHRQVERPRNKWSEIALSFVALGITLAGVKTEGFEWLLYLTIPIILIALFLILIDSGLSKKATCVIHCRRDRKVLNQISDEYESFLDKIEIVKKITEEISDLESNSTTRGNYSYPYNKISELKILLAKYDDSKALKVLVLNHVLSIHIEAADRYFCECDFFVINRNLKYKHEHDKAEMLKLIRKYETFRDQHNEFCKITNAKLKNSFLRCFYDQTFSFVPKEVVLEASEKV